MLRGTSFILTSLLLSSALAATLPFVQRDSSCEWIQPLPKTDRPRTRRSNARNVVLFTDGSNFDDVVSVLFLAKSVKSKLLAIYIQGNAFSNPGSSSRHHYNLLHMMGTEFDDVPIYLGSYYAIRDELDAAQTGQPVKLRYREPIPFGANGNLYADTMYGTAQYVPQGPRAYDIRKTPDEDFKSIPALFELIKSVPSTKNFTFLSIGTLTPIAKMFGDDYVEQMQQFVVPRISRLVVMGGAVNDLGNLFTKLTNLKAEFNIYNDPHAAQWAFANLTERGVPVTLVPLDGTNDVPIEPRLLDGLRNSPKTPEAQFVGRLMENLRDSWFDPPSFFETAFLWDPSATIVSVTPRVVTDRRKIKMRIVLEQGVDGPEQGWTKPCDEEEIMQGKCFPITVVFGLNGTFVTDILLNTLQSSTNSARFSLACL